MYPARKFVSLLFLNEPVLLLFVTFIWEQTFVLAAATTTTTTTTTIRAKLDSL
jgi:hypothetical protein